MSTTEETFETELIDPAASLAAALEAWSFAHRPVIPARGGTIVSCKCLDRVFTGGSDDWDRHLADSLQESFVVSEIAIPTESA